MHGWILNIFSRLTLRGRAREELVSKTSQFKYSPASSVTDL